MARLRGSASRITIALAVAGASAVLAVLALGGADSTSAPRAASAPAGAMPVATNCPDMRALSVPVNSPGQYGNDDGTARGGCVFRVRGHFAFHMLSVVDDLDFASCDMEFTFRVDGQGRVIVNDTAVRGASPCNDAQACSEEYEPPELWRGQIAADGDGAFRLDLNVCFDTCMGRFRGPLETRVVPESGRRWRLELDPSHGRVGNSGWRLEGDAWGMTSKRPVRLDAGESSSAGS